MTIALRTALLVALSLAVFAACGGGGGPKGPRADLVAARNSIPLYSESESRTTGRPPSGFYEVEHPEHFANDAGYFVAVPDAAEAIHEYFRTELPKLGWAVEDPVVPSSDEQLAGYCETIGFVTCSSYTRDDVRVIVVSVITFSFGGTGREGTPYYLHLEDR